MCNYNDRQYGELPINVIGLYSGVLDGDTEGRFRTRCLSKAVGTRPWVTHLDTDLCLPDSLQV